MNKRLPQLILLAQGEYFFELINKNKSALAFLGFTQGFAHSPVQLFYVFSKPGYDVLYWW